MSPSIRQVFLKLTMVTLIQLKILKFVRKAVTQIMFKKNRISDISETLTFLSNSIKMK